MIASYKTAATYLRKLADEVETGSYTVIEFNEDRGVQEFVKSVGVVPEYREYESTGERTITIRLVK